MPNPSPAPGATPTTPTTPHAAGATLAPSATTSPPAWLTPLERSHAIIDLAYSPPRHRLGDVLIAKAYDRTVGFLMSAIHAPPTDPSRQLAVLRIASDLSTGLNDAHRLKRALNALHQADMQPANGQARQGLSPPAALKASDPFAVGGSMVGGTEVAAADAIFVQALENLDAILSAEFQRIAPSLQMGAHGEILAQLRLLTRTLRASLTGERLRIALHPPTSPAPPERQASPSLMKGWHAGLAQAEPLLRHMATLGLMRPLVAAKPSRPGQTHTQWTTLSGIVYTSESASFSDELPLPMLMHWREQGRTHSEPLSEGKVRDWFFDAQRKWAQHKAELSRIQLAHGRDFNAAERSALHHLMNELDDKIESAGRIAGLQGGRTDLADAAHEALQVLRRQRRPRKLRPLISNEERMAPVRDLMAVMQLNEKAAAQVQFSTPSSPLVRDDLPMPVLQAVMPGLTQSFDRASGVVHFRDVNDVLVSWVAVSPLDHYRKGGFYERAAKRRQDLDVLALESFVLGHLNPKDGKRPFSLPPLRLRNGRVESGGRLLATAEMPARPEDSAARSPGWRLHRDHIASTLRLLRASPPLSSDAAQWGMHGLDLPLPAESGAPASSPGLLRLVFQLEDSPDALTAAWLRYRKIEQKHPGTAVWLQQGSEGATRVKRGQSLLDAMGDDTTVQIELVGRSGRLPLGEQGLAGWSAGELAGRLMPWLQTLGVVDPPDPAPVRLRPPARRVTDIKLVACDMAVPGLDDNYATRFLERLMGEDWAGGVRLTAPTGELHVTESAGDADAGGRIRNLMSHVEADGTRTLSHHQPGDFVVMTVDRRHNEIRVVDRYTAPRDLPLVDGRVNASALALLHDIAMDGEAAGPALARPPAPPPESLMNDILAALSPQTRAFLGDLDVDAIGNIRTVPPDAAGTPLERVMAGIAADVFDDPDGLTRLASITEDQALSDLQSRGLVDLDADGAPRLNGTRLYRLSQGKDEAAILRPAAALLKLPAAAFDQLWTSSRGWGRRLLARARDVRAFALKALQGLDKGSIPGLGLGAVNTAIGAFQMAQGWRTMGATLKGLSLAQLSNIVVTPMTMKLGAWLWAHGGLARGRLLGAISKALSGGVVDMGLSGLGLVVLSLQWGQFVKNGLDLGSLTGRSLTANTSLVCAFTFVSLVMSGVQLATAFAGGASAVAGTALGAAFAATNLAALPVALLAMAVSGAVNAGLWIDEYGKFIRGSTDAGAVFLAGLAKFIGLDTDVTRRAETEKGAVEAARARSGALDAAWRDQMAFRADALAKAGYGRILYPALSFPVKHATFKVAGAEPPYTFVLQDGPPNAARMEELQRKTPPATRTPRTAWLELARAPRLEWPDSASAQVDQLFELSGTRGSFTGGRGNDRFLLDGSSAATIDGAEGVDELVMDAQGRKIGLRPADKGSDSSGARTSIHFRLTVDNVAAHSWRVNSVLDVERWTIRNASEAEIHGGIGDEHFDVTAGRTLIDGGGGRNTYLLRSGNRVVTTSNDIAIWSRGVNARIEFSPDQPASLLLKLDVLHDALAFRRSGDDLLVLCGADTLTLARYFTRGASTPQDPALVFIDALGTRMMLMNPRAAGDAPRTAASMDMHLFLDAATPAWRRSLTGALARTRHHLGAGAGAFRAAPRTAAPLDIALEVPVECLRYRRVGGNIVIEEIAPQAAASYRPLALTLPGLARAGGDPQHPTLWARATDEGGATAPLRLPLPGEAPQGPMRLAASAAAASRSSVPPFLAPGVGASAESGAESSTESGTGGDDCIDAGSSPAGTVLAGGHGADTYRVPAGHSVVIDNSAMDMVQDLLELAIQPEDLRLRRDGADLLIEGGGSTVRLRGHAADPLARHLTLALVGYTTRYALPVIHESGAMVYSADGSDGDIPGFVPGTHVVLAAPGARWSPRPQHPRAVLVRRQAVTHIEHDSLVITWHAGGTPGPASSSVFVQDHYLAPAHHRADPLTRHQAALMQRLTGDSRSPLLPPELEATWRRYQAQGADASIVALLHTHGIVDNHLVTGISRIAAEARDEGPDLPDQSPHDLNAVRAYFALKGLPADIARQLRSTTPAQLRRMHRLLAVAAEAGVTLPAAFIDDYAASAVATSLSALRHGELLAHLVGTRAPWGYAERVLSHDVPLDMLLAFEAWVRPRPAGHATPSASLPALDELARLLASTPADPLAINAFTRPMLERMLLARGRPPAVAKALAAAMTAVKTLDEDWVDGMQRAGVLDHALLQRLRAAQVPVQDLVLGNARRLAYEGDGDRSSLIEVGTRGALGQERAGRSHRRVVLLKHLRLNASGSWFDRIDDMPVPGVRYDLVPGDIVPQAMPSPQKKRLGGLSTQEVAAHLLDQLLGTDSDAPPPDAAEHLRAFRLVRYEADRIPPSTAWWGRSSPANLVDGSREASEATAWAPFMPDDGETALPLHGAGPSAALVFAFKDAVALTGLQLYTAPVTGAAQTPARQDTGLWHLYAIGAGDEPVMVSGDVFIDGAGLAIAVAVDTHGVPYTRYELRARSGRFPTQSMFTEVTFTTTDAGLPARPASPPVEAARRRSRPSLLRELKQPAPQQPATRQANLLAQAVAAHAAAGDGFVARPPLAARTRPPLALLPTQTG